mgnify:CR=1 FL=1
MLSEYEKKYENWDGELPAFCAFSVIILFCENSRRELTLNDLCTIFLQEANSPVVVRTWEKNYRENGILCFQRPSSAQYPDEKVLLVLVFSF